MAADNGFQSALAFASGARGDEGEEKCIALE
jgi:hypothetical protein